jgi:hypothetical protein
MTFYPPGHIPGFHIPGTLTPIGAVVELQNAQAAHVAELQRAQAAAAEQEAAAANLLLLLS